MEDRNAVLLDTAHKILEQAENSGVPVRFLGGIAVLMKCPSAHVPPLAREINDLDVVVPKKSVYDFKRMILQMGFEGDRQFNSIHGETRMLFFNEQMDLDVFIGIFEQCHILNLEEVMLKSSKTISLADLLLTKLQIVQINLKDMLDIYSILIDNPIVESDEDEGINLRRILSITAKDWGWYTTIEDNLVKLASMAKDVFDSDNAKLLAEKILFIKNSMENSQKSINWKIRAKIGRKVHWYNLPEEKKI